MATSLRQIDADDPSIGGFAITYPSSTVKLITWRASKPISPVLTAAKQYAAVALNERLESGAVDDAERTNWASVTACIQKLISDFNARLSKL